MMNPIPEGRFAAIQSGVGPPHSQGRPAGGTGTHSSQQQCLWECGDLAPLWILAERAPYQQWILWPWPGNQMTSTTNDTPSAVT